MNRLKTFFKKLQLRQMLTIFLAGALLIISTACSNATNAQGANPDNPAVQAGGMNNPYKAGGDSYTNQKISTDPKVSKAPAAGQDHASLQLSPQLIAASNADKKSEMLYPAADEPAGRAEKEAELPFITNKDFVQPEEGGLNQRNPDLGERLGNRVEKAQEAFKEAGSFLKGKADEVGARPEGQPNPALKK